MESMAIRGRLKSRVMTPRTDAPLLPVKKEEARRTGPVEYRCTNRPVLILTEVIHYVACVACLLWIYALDRRYAELSARCYSVFWVQAGLALTVGACAMGIGIHEAEGWVYMSLRDNPVAPRLYDRAKQMLFSTWMSTGFALVSVGLNGPLWWALVVPCVATKWLPTSQKGLTIVAVTLTEFCTHYTFYRLFPYWYLPVAGVCLDFVNVGFIFKLKNTDNQVYHFAHDIATSSIIFIRAWATLTLVPACAYGVCT